MRQQRATDAGEREAMRGNAGRGYAFRCSNAYPCSASTCRGSSASAFSKRRVQFCTADAASACEEPRRCPRRVRCEEPRVCMNSHMMREESRVRRVTCGTASERGHGAENAKPKAKARNLRTLCTTDIFFFAMISGEISFHLYDRGGIFGIDFRQISVQRHCLWHSFRGHLSSKRRGES
eukprot:1165060-Rhodomonas_salina.2